MLYHDKIFLILILYIYLLRIFMIDPKNTKVNLTYFIFHLQMQNSTFLQNKFQMFFKPNKLMSLFHCKIWPAINCFTCHDLYNLFWGELGISLVWATGDDPGDLSRKFWDLIGWWLICRVIVIIISNSSL